MSKRIKVLISILAVLIIALAGFLIINSKNMKSSADSLVRTSTFSVLKHHALTPFDNLKHHITTNPFENLKHHHTTSIAKLIEVKGQVVDMNTKMAISEIVINIYNEKNLALAPIQLVTDQSGNYKTKLSASSYKFELKQKQDNQLGSVKYEMLSVSGVVVEYLPVTKIFQLKPIVPILPIVTTSLPTDITASSAVLQGSIINVGSLPTIGRGFQFGLTMNPDYAGSAGWSYDAGSFRVGTYSKSTNLLTAGLQIKPDTTYYVRALVKNTKGSGYGNWVQFKTPKATVPVVTTGLVTKITSSSAVFQGNLVSTGGLPTTLRGFQYSLTELPVGAGSAGYTYDLGSFKAGTFFRDTNPLMAGSLKFKPNTVYYVRAIVRNAQGAGYGNWVKFKTGANWLWFF